MLLVRHLVNLLRASQSHARWMAPALAIWIAGCASAGTAVLVEDGVAGEALKPSERWAAQQGQLVGSGVGHVLAPALELGEGDCTIAVRLSLDELNGSAASFVIGGSSHFGFDGRTDGIFGEGPVFGGGVHGLGDSSDFITAGEVFEFVVERRRGTLRFLINGDLIHEQDDPRDAMGTIGLRPHRATMRIADWAVRGNLVEVLQPALIDVFASGEGGYHTFRIPAIIRAANGDLLAFAEGRVNHGGDSGDIDTVMKRSTDGGATWGELQLVGDFGTGCVGNAAPVVDQASGDIVMLAVLQPDGSHEADIRNNRGGYRDPCVLRSTDHGETWSEPVSLFETCDREDWRWYATGPCHGIQLRHGEYAGRMVVPANFSVVGGGGNDHLGAHALLSDDAGATWRIGAVDDTHVGENEINPNESTVVELSDGRLLFNARDQGGTSRATRLATLSDDGGETYVGPYEVEEDLVGPVCQAALLGVDTDAGRVIVYSGPGVWDSRARMQLRYSTDAGESWHDGPVLHPGSAAYSDLVQVDDDTLGCLFEADGYSRIVFSSVSIQALLNSSDE